MSADERFAIVFEKMKQIELQEGVIVTYQPTRESEEIRRLLEIVTEVVRPNYRFVTSGV
jgi:hypothetical protein